jgi:hypothetical protein
MLNERRATLHRDAGAGVARLVVDDAPPAAGEGEEIAVTLLLDAQGGLVGVDLGGGGLSRMVVMVGAHEDVATTRDAHAVVVRAADGEPVEVRVPNGPLSL